MGAQAGKRKILVGISGGPSSAVTAALLKSQGCEVVGVHLQMCDPKASGPTRFGARCCLTKSLAAAQEVCKKLDIPFHSVNVESRFEDKVVDPFVHDLLQAKYPIACIPCNLEIRFDTLLLKADELGCEQVATGHHAQVFRDAVRDESKPATARLLRAVNARKDQTYFLFGLTQKQLSRLVFPLGGFQDAMIERLAREFDLPDQMVGDPQEPCFFKGMPYLAFFEARVPQSLRPRGNIKMTDGSVMGEHRGLYAYQVGQKVKLAAHVKEQDKYQVIAFDVPNHALVIGYEKDLFHAELRAVRATWVKPVDGLHGLVTHARFHPAQKEAAPCRVTHFENSVLRVEFDQPQKGILVGQAIVFYEGDEVLGGAIIEEVGSQISLEK